MASIVLVAASLLFISLPIVDSFFGGKVSLRNFERKTSCLNIQPKFEKFSLLYANVNNNENREDDGEIRNPEDLGDLYKTWEEEFLAEEVEELNNSDSIDDIEEDMEAFTSAKKKRKEKYVPGELPMYMKRIIAESTGVPIDDNIEPTPASKLPIIAIIGRPNTGKSTIVNKLTDTYNDGAIVHDEAGITRDRTYRTAMWNNYNFQVVDTGGIVFDDSSDIFAEKITEQALLALGEASAAVMVVDGQEGMTQLDTVLADWLRRKNKVPMYVAVNKCESERLGIAQAQEFWSLGLGEPYPVSGIHGTGLNDLLDVITQKHMTKVTHVLKENATNVAFIGRPNVGKSSLFNRIYGEERSIVSDIAGTTRDTVDALLTRGDRQYRIIDTAGIRRRGKVDYGPEYFMVNRAFKAIQRADVVVLMLDALDGIVEQDRVLAERIAADGRACIICLNKWDIVPNKDDKTYIKAIENIRVNMPALRWAEVLLVSAKTGQRTEKLFETIDRAASQFHRRVSTAVMNEIIQEATLWMAPPKIGSRSGRIYYTIQASSSPPTLVIFCNDPALFTDNYKRYLERKVRENLGFEGTPIRMLWRGKSLRDIGRSAKKADPNLNLGAARRS